MDMIIKSRESGKWALEIFINFQTDRKLLKHYIPPPPRDKEYDSGTPDVAMMEPKNFQWTTPAWGEAPPVASMGPVKRQLYRWLFTLPGLRMKMPEAPSGDIDPIEVFKEVRDGTKKITNYIERVSKLEDSIQLAKQAGQTARVEALEKARKLVEYESLLLAGGFPTYMTEQALIEFASKCQKGLALTWIGNYANPIPDVVVEKKIEADKLKAFDNYVVLHYDPKGLAFSLTEKQIAAKKDPILFGVIANSHKLYFVADWKDETDDLDMQEVNRVLGHLPDTIPNDPTPIYSTEHL